MRLPVLLLLALGTALAGEVAAQVSPSGLPVGGWPGEMAMAGGGAVAWNDRSRAVMLPVLGLEPGHSAIFGSLAFDSPDNDFKFTRLGAVVRLGSRFAVSAGTSRSALDNVIDDPSVPDGQFPLSDWELRAGAAMRFPSLRSAVGLSGQLLRSEVFSTQISGTNIGGALLIEPAPRLRFLAAVNGVGAPLRFDYSGGGGTRRTQPGSLLLATGLGIVNRPRWDQHLYLDAEQQLRSDGTQRVSVATDALLAGAVTLRAGVTLRRDRPLSTEWRRRVAVGGSVRVSRLVIEYGYASGLTPDDLSPHQTFGVQLLLHSDHSAPPSAPAGPVAAPSR